MEKITKEHYIYNFRSRLAEAWEMCGLSYHELEARLEVTRTTLYNWKTVERKDGNENVTKMDFATVLGVSSLLDFMTESNKGKRAELLSLCAVGSNTMFQNAIGKSAPKSLTEAWLKESLSPEEQNMHSEISINRLSEYEILLDIFSLSENPVKTLIIRLGQIKPLVLHLWSRDIDSLRKISGIEQIEVVCVLDVLGKEKNRLPLGRWDNGGTSDSCASITEAFKANRSPNKILITSDYSNAAHALNEKIKVGFLDSDGSLIDIESFPEGIRYVQSIASAEIAETGFSAKTPEIVKIALGGI